MKKTNKITVNPQKVVVDNLSNETKYIHQLILNEDRKGYIFFKTQLTQPVKNELESIGYGILCLGGNNYKVIWAF